MYKGDDAPIALPFRQEHKQHEDYSYTKMADQQSPAKLIVIVDDNVFYNVACRLLCALIRHGKLNRPNEDLLPICRQTLERMAAMGLQELVEELDEPLWERVKAASERPHGSHTLKMMSTIWPDVVRWTLDSKDWRAREGEELPVTPGNVMERESTAQKTSTGGSASKIPKPPTGGKPVFGPVPPPGLSTKDPKRSSLPKPSASKPSTKATAAPKPRPEASRPRDPLVAGGGVRERERTPYISAGSDPISPIKVPKRQRSPHIPASSKPIHPVEVPEIQERVRIPYSWKPGGPKKTAPTNPADLAKKKKEEADLARARKTYVKPSVDVEPEPKPRTPDPDQFYAPSANPFHVPDPDEFYVPEIPAFRPKKREVKPKKPEVKPEQPEVKAKQPDVKPKPEVRPKPETRPKPVFGPEPPPSSSSSKPKKPEIQPKPAPKPKPEAKPNPQPKPPQPILKLRPPPEPPNNPTNPKPKPILIPFPREEYWDETIDALQVYDREIYAPIGPDLPWDPLPEPEASRIGESGTDPPAYYRSERRPQPTPVARPGFVTPEVKLDRGGYMPMVLEPGALRGWWMDDLSGGKGEVVEGEAGVRVGFDEEAYGRLAVLCYGLPKGKVVLPGAGVVGAGAPKAGESTAGKVDAGKVNAGKAEVEELIAGVPEAGKPKALGSETREPEVKAPEAGDCEAEVSESEYSDAGSSEPEESGAEEDQAEEYRPEEHEDEEYEEEYEAEED